jgi:hypothetical protein
MDAHNCYPERGQWRDRIDRALRVAFPVGIEQDLAWYGGRAVVSHTAETSGAEPAVRDYFFERVRPVVERALAEGDRTAWPLIVLHFDFKDLRPELLRSVWALLGEYEAWITTAAKGGDPRVLQPLDAKPLLVLTEDADEQEEIFFRQVPAGGRLRVFGSAHTAPIRAASDAERWKLDAAIAPARLLTTAPTNYRRWWNESWFKVEEGGATRAADWTAADDRRLRALVDHAHHLGYWIRFYTLDGFSTAENRGWNASYNFGSRQAAELRWKAAISAGVDLIATDQYEDVAALLQSGAGKRR